MFHKNSTVTFWFREYCQWSQNFSCIWSLLLNKFWWVNYRHCISWIIIEVLNSLLYLVCPYSYGKQGRKCRTWHSEAGRFWTCAKTESSRTSRSSSLHLPPHTSTRCFLEWHRPSCVNKCDTKMRFYYPTNAYWCRCITFRPRWIFPS